MITTRLYNKTILFSLLLGASLVLSIWMTSSLLSSKSSNTKTNLPNNPDAFMTGMQYTQFDQHGQWKSSLTADHMTHYAAEDTAVFSKPLMTSRDQNQLIWIISAAQSTNKHGDKVIYLQNNVQVQRFEHLNQKTLDLTTSALTTYPKQKTMETDQPVTIIQPGSVINAVGLTGDMNTGDIHLLSNTRGVYEHTTSANDPKDSEKS